MLLAELFDAEANIPKPVGADLVCLDRGGFSLEPLNMKLFGMRSSAGLRKSTSSSASRKESPLPSKAVKKRASSLHSSQSPSSFARLNRRTSCSELDESSSNVCSTSR